MSEILLILYIVFWVIGLIFVYSWPNMPPWSPHAYNMVMFALIGLIMLLGPGIGGHAGLLR